MLGTVDRCQPHCNTSYGKTHTLSHLPQVLECLWVPDISPATEIFAAVLDPEVRLVYLGLGD